jgi:mRNA interferase YafQ
MYKVFLSKDFIKSAHRLERSGKFKKEEVNDILRLLALGKPLPANYRDHALKGDMRGRRECHVSRNILLTYRKDNEVLLLIALDIGTHQELFGT